MDFPSKEQVREKVSSLRPEDREWLKGLPERERMIATALVVIFDCTIEPEEKK